MIPQADLHRLANTLDQLAPLVRNAHQALKLAADWEGQGAATALTAGSRSSRVNDLSGRIVTGGDHDIETQGPTATLRPPAQYDGMASRLDLMFHELFGLPLDRMLADLRYCQRTIVTRDNDALALARTNSKTGHCETCFTAGRADSYQRGTLEHIDLERTTMADEPDRHDLCRNCAKSAHGARADARSSGRDFDYNEWADARIARLRSIRVVW